jgi:hypothetical protein
MRTIPHHRYLLPVDVKQTQQFTLFYYSQESLSKTPGTVVRPGKTRRKISGVYIDDLRILSPGSIFFKYKKPFTRALPFE